MADNATIYPGDTGTPIIVAADLIGSALFQRFKIAIGADGTNDGDVSSANPLPVSVSGTVTVGAHAVTNGGTFAVQESGAALTALQLIDNIVLAEDAAHASGDPGVMMLGVRKDTAAQVAGTDGDYCPAIFDSSGRMHVNVGNTITVGTHAVTATDLDIRDLSSATDSVSAVQSGTWNVTNISGTVSLPTGAATSAKQPALGTAGTASADVVTIQGIASMTAVKVDGSAVTQPVSGTFWQATQPISAASLPLPSGASTSAKQPALGTAGSASADVITVQGIASMTPMLVTASIASAQTLATITTVGTITNVVHVDDNSGSLTVDNAGTFAVQVSSALPAGSNAIGKLAANSGVDIGDVDVTSLPAITIASAQTLATVTTVGTVTTCSTVSTLTGSGIAHDAADSGNPHKVGAKATTSLSTKTLVSNDDRTDLFAGVDGVQITRPHCNLEDIVRGRAAITDGSSTSVIAAAGSGVKVYVTTIAISNSSATAVEVDIRDGAAGTVMLTLPVPANTSGVVCNLPVPMPFTANTAVCADPSAAASTITVTLIGFKSKV